MAFIRSKTTHGKYRVTTNYYLVESVRTAGGVKQRVLFYFGCYKPYKPAYKQLAKEIAHEQMIVRMRKKDLKRGLNWRAEDRCKEIIESCQARIAKLRTLAKEFKKVERKYGQ